MITEESTKSEGIASEVDPRALSAELVELLKAVVENPGNWMATPNVQFGGRRPGDLIETGEEFKILDILHAVDQGLF